MALTSRHLRDIVLSHQSVSSTVNLCGRDLFSILWYLESWSLSGMLQMDQLESLCFLKPAHGACTPAASPISLWSEGLGQLAGSGTGNQVEQRQC